MQHHNQPVFNDIGTTVIQLTEANVKKLRGCIMDIMSYSYYMLSRNQNTNSQYVLKISSF